MQGGTIPLGGEIEEETHRHKLFKEITNLGRLQQKGSEYFMQSQLLLSFIFI